MQCQYALNGCVRMRLNTQKMEALVLYFLLILCYLGAQGQGMLK